MKKVLIVTDMLEGFLREGYPLYCGKEAEKIIPFVRDKIKEYSDRGETIIFIADNHKPDDLEFKMFPPHCVEGTAETKVLPELLEAASECKIIPKTRYSAFYGTALDQELEEIAPDLVEVVGVCTNICVLFTVEELRNRDYSVVVYRDGVATFNPEAHRHALKQIKEILGAEVR